MERKSEKAYKRKLEKMALQKSRGEMTREMTYERAPAITEKIRGQVYLLRFVSGFDGFWRIGA